MWCQAENVCHASVSLFKVIRIMTEDLKTENAFSLPWFWIMGEFEPFEAALMAVVCVQTIITWLN